VPARAERRRKDHVVSNLVGVATAARRHRGDRRRDLKPYDIAQRLAYVPQAQVTEFSYSVLDIVLMGRTARLRSFASSASEDRRTALDKLKSLGIGELAGEDYTQISGGQQQLVLIARALKQPARPATSSRRRRFPCCTAPRSKSR